MKDMIGQDLTPGDYFIMPGGNARYGGLILEVGIIISMTEKRIKTLVTKFDKVKTKPVNKTPKKVLKIQINDSLRETEAIQKLQAIFETL